MFRSLSKTQILVLFLVYAGHVLIDTLAKDLGAPYGVPLFWPFDSHYYISPVILFSNFSHGTHNEGLSGVIQDTSRTQPTVAIEMAIVGPLLWLTERYRRRAD